MPARNIFFKILILIIAGLVAYLQATGRYELTPPLAALSFVVLGIVSASLFNQLGSQKYANTGFLLSLFLSFCFFFIVYFIGRRADNHSLLTSIAYTGCFLLPCVISENWQIYRLAFQPAAIGFWSLPVPYVKSNAISLHLNSIPFTIKVASTPDSAEKDYPVTAPGIKTLGMVFSELVYEDKTTGEPVDFSDIRDNPYSWAFHVRGFGGLNNRQVDANLSLLDNRLKTDAIVIAQRRQEFTKPMRN